MKKFNVLFTMPMACSCVVEAKDTSDAVRKTSGETWKQLKDAGYEPQIDCAEIDQLDKADVYEIEENTEDEQEFT